MKKVSVMCFHDELCQVFNALIMALNLLRGGSRVTLFFGSRGINAVHRDKMKTLTCLPDEPRELGEALLAKMDEMGLPLVEALFVGMQAHGSNVRLGVGHKSPDYQWWYGQPAVDGDLLRIKGLIGDRERGREFARASHTAK